MVPKPAIPRRALNALRVAAGQSTGHQKDTVSGRYDATVSDVRHWTQPADKRQDVDRVLAHLDFANGAAWWLVDAGTVKVGDRYRITVEVRA